MIDDKSGKLTVDIEPILKVVLVRRETGREGNRKDLQSIQQSQVLQMRKQVQRDYFLKAT